VEPISEIKYVNVSVHVVLRWFRHTDAHVSLCSAVVVWCVSADWKLWCDQPQFPFVSVWYRVESHGLLVAC